MTASASAFMMIVFFLKLIEAAVTERTISTNAHYSL